MLDIPTPVGPTFRSHPGTLGASAADAIACHVRVHQADIVPVDQELQGLLATFAHIHHYSLDDVWTVANTAVGAVRQPRRVGTVGIVTRTLADVQRADHPSETCGV